MNKIWAVLTIAMFLSVATVSAAYGNADMNTQLNLNTNTQASVNGDAAVDANADVSTSSNTNTNTGSDGNLLFRLSNGLNADIKIMPSVASSIAIEKLGLHSCTEENNCTIVLKEVGRDSKRNQTNVTTKSDVKAAYVVEVDKEAKIFGIFKKKMHVTAQIDAETGEMIEIQKPWWASLSSETDAYASANADSSAAYK
jgi:hypothetical protein